MTPQQRAQREREAAQARAPGRWDDQVSLSALRMPAAVRALLADAAEARAAMGPEPPGRPDRMWAATLELDIALLADAMAGRPPDAAATHHLRQLANALHTLAQAAEARAATQKAAA